MQFVAGFVERQYVNAIREDLFALEESVGADDYVPSLAAVGNGTRPYGDLRLALPVFQTLASEIRTALLVNDAGPVPACPRRRPKAEELTDFVCHRSS